MAFNPFHGFRRHQKKVFAVLAVVCMVLFVLSSGAGGGDILNQLTDWAGTRSGGGKVVATLDGKKLDEREMELFRYQRRLASAYMNAVTGISRNQIYRAAMDRGDRLDPQLAGLVRSFNEFMFRYQFGQLPPQYGPAEILAILGSFQSQFSSVRAMIEAGNAPDKQEQVTIATNLMLAVNQEREQFERQRLAVAARGRGEGFFGGDPDEQDDLLDFLVWRKEAERLGIQFSQGDVHEMVRAEMLNQPLDQETANQINRGLREQFPQYYNTDRLLAALAEEFRVRTAKSAFLGKQLAGGFAFPITGTPDELFNWYRDVRTAVRAGLIDVPVADFVPKVTERPTEAQLRELFDKHKNDEHDPRLERPGFKEPRKVKVDWFAVPADAPFYLKAAEQGGPVLRTLAAFGAATAAGGSAEAAAVLGIAMADVGVARLYQDYLNDLPKWTDPLAFGRRSGLHDSSVLNRDAIRTFIGTSIAAGATGAGPLAGPLALEGQAVVQEMRDRARIGASAILAGALEPAPLAIDALAMRLMPPPLAESTLRPALAERAREELARQLRDLDVRTFGTELAKRGREQDANNAAAFAGDFIHTRGLQRGGTAQPVDRFSLGDDPGLASLRRVADAEFKRQSRTDPTGEIFAAFLADGPDNIFDRNARPQNFQAQRFGDGNTAYVFWRTDDREPRTITFEAAKPRVEAAWVFQKARGLAQQEADRLATAARATGGDLQKLRDLAAATPRGLIEVGPLAVWNPQVNLSGGPARYGPPAISPDKILHAGDAMATAIVDLRKQEVGAATVVHDVPKRNFFAAALTNKDVPTIDQFRIAYRGSMEPAGLREGLFDILAGERYRRYERELTKQLRDENKLVVTAPKKGEAGG